jgi:hypothetical protein
MVDEYARVLVEEDFVQRGARGFRDVHEGEHVRGTGVGGRDEGGESRAAGPWAAHAGGSSGAAGRHALPFVLVC